MRDTLGTVGKGSQVLEYCVKFWCPRFQKDVEKLNWGEESKKNNSRNGENVSQWGIWRAQPVLFSKKKIKTWFDYCVYVPSQEKIQGPGGLFNLIVKDRTRSNGWELEPAKFRFEKSSLLYTAWLTTGANCRGKRWILHLLIKTGAFLEEALQQTQVTGLNTGITGWNLKSCDKGGETK